MNLETIYLERKKILNYLYVGAAIGALIGVAEYIVRLKIGDDPQEFFPLLIISSIVGSAMLVTVVIFELLFKGLFAQKPYLYLVFVKSVSYTLIIIFWLTVENGIWFAVKSDGSFQEEISHYFRDNVFLINLISAFFVMVLIVGLTQINSLHRKGELLNFILGKYHKPREVERIFCFIDLKSSTTIAEKIGNLKYAMFLKDYYSDITEVIRKTDAQIYQYVGDEIVLRWSYEKGLKNNNLINCYFEMRETIESLKQKYMRKYGVYPEFKAGLHGGQAIVTWVGEMKKEIVYIGDVLNTTARIQEYCKRLGKDFLISGELLKRIEKSKNFKASFVEETILRGKENQMKLYSLELED